jgi:hypothetical protein
MADDLITGCYYLNFDEFVMRRIQKGFGILWLMGPMKLMILYRHPIIKLASFQCQYLNAKTLTIRDKWCCSALAQISFLLTKYSLSAKYKISSGV